MQLLEFVREEERPYRWGDCANCPISPAVVRGWGSSKSGIAVIGESPGENEVREGRPFVGPSGMLIKAVLQKLGQNPDDVYYTNALLCHAEKPTKQAIIACNKRLHEELADVGAKKVLLLGAISLQALLSPGHQHSITANRGKGMLLAVNGKATYVMPTYHPAAVLRDPELFRDLVADVEKFLKNDEIIQPQLPHVYVCWNAKQAIRRLPLLMSATKLSCDIETTGLSSKGDIIISVGFGVKRKDGELESHIVPSFVMNKPEVKSLVLKLLKDFEGKLVFHNGKFDLRMLSEHYGFPIHPKKFTDTLLQHLTLDERASSENTFGRRRVPKRHGLKALVRFEYDFEYGFDFEEFWAIEQKTKEDWEKLFYYQGLDCSFTYMLEDLFTERMDEKAQQLLDQILYPASLVLQDIENSGVPIDVAYMTNMQQELETELKQLNRSLSKLVKETTGISDWRTERQKKIKSSEPAKFNPGSYVHVKRLIYTEWKTPYQQSMTHLAKQRRKEGKEYWSTDDITLTQLAEKELDATRREVLRGIIDWRAKKTLLSKEIVGLVKLVDKDSRVRPSFLLHGTVTGRLSCVKPNVQNISVRKGNAIETGYRAREGWSIVEADYSQLEIRILAEFSKDEKLVYACHHEDIHGDIASRVFNKPANEVSDFERKMTKTMVFGTLYGRSAKGILSGEEMGELVKRGMRRWTEDEANAFIQRLLNLYPGMKNYFARAKQDALQKHCVEYSVGRRRRFPFISDKNRDEVLRQAVNAPVQGTASDVCLNALVRLHHKLPNDRAIILLTVHDSILFEIKNEAVKEILSVIRSTMEEITLFTPTVPFKVKIKVGPDWGHTEEVAV